MAISRQDILGTLSDVGFASLRESIQSAIGKSDPAILLNNTGWRAKLADVVINHPGGVATGIDSLATLVGRVAGHYSPLAGKAVDEFGEAVAFGLKDLAVRAKTGEKITHGEVEQALGEASKTLQVMRTLRSGNLKYLRPGQPGAFFALLQAARAEQITDHEGLRDLSGDAFRIVSGLLFALDDDPQLLVQTLPTEFTYEDVIKNPRGTCHNTIAMVTTIKFMPWETVLDMIDYTFNINTIRSTAGSWIHSAMNAIKWIVGIGVVGYVLFLAVSIGLFLLTAAIFVGSHILILVAPVGKDLFWLWTAMVIAFLYLLFFRYTFTVLDLFHSLLLWLGSKLGIRDENSWVGLGIRLTASLFNKQEILQHLPGGSKAGNTQKPASLPWAVSFASTVFIAAIAVFALTILNQIMGRTIESAMLVAITELLVLLAVEVTRRVGFKLSDKFHRKNAVFTIKWVTRAMLASIILLGIVSFLGIRGASSIVGWVRSGPESIRSTHEQVETSTTSKATTPEEKACAYARKYGKKLPSYCK
ncbi:MAG: hypothetical protein UU40_C0005G0003 [Candidatus Uhrbacteria bacterium GW2011_GWD2_41_121]|uniref:Uncharacterized protein n=1 Tax=Candidatus Uhrbacteria bacterium GW2011_GWC1_41_20 TaxID=1618983 RepID=A0A0G0VIR2_9BACT|nr:MAG: hypothetical protein UT52_C0007G0003 [Candidatus Uhrbacteria bacterium GW2011_GWE1_39_46]KKR64139.1 MAG: hypothetical protein UU04_C0005G0003 [Candidatus Uhrbacteria bacterium GW2011_GWC2_40_450]KKR90274.1 MAG: hypothetical protein UU40_C0005G0003 [Candidatus Uhrbacteria bacterium GW2011_GWD2_41_121]KKR95201.1 MAG: hypothetical protein UU46_C0026G0003 [Candidatus Uhrbacteria bacterium GW2011_GWD1_41_16]KKR99496.1 MAG: hypothetical protein UU50_C0005G0003 [Candidatus Uhrbacteria bacteriu